MLKKIEQIHWDIWIKIGLLLALTIFYIKILWTGDASLYVHPRLIPYLKGTVGVLVLLIAVHVKAFKGLQRTRPSFEVYMPFVVAFSMALALPVVTINAGAGGGPSFELSQKKEFEENYKGLNQESELPSVEAAPSTESAVGQNETAAIGSGEVTEDPVLTLNAGNYLQLLQAINNQPIDYEGVQVKLVGFVFKDPGFEKNQFVAARSLMVCCAADAETVGLLAVYEKANQLKENQWVEITGNVTITEYKGETMPAIEVSELKAVEAPLDPYIYPY